MQKRTYRKVTVGETAADPSQPSPCPGATALAVPVMGIATPWTVAQQASLSMGFSRQGYWSGLTQEGGGGH